MAERQVNIGPCECCGSADPGCCPTHDSDPTAYLFIDIDQASVGAVPYPATAPATVGAIAATIGGSYAVFSNSGGNPDYLFFGGGLIGNDLASVSMPFGSTTALGTDVTISGPTTVESRQVGVWLLTDMAYPGTDQAMYAPGYSSDWTVEFDADRRVCIVSFYLSSATTGTFTFDATVYDDDGHTASTSQSLVTSAWSPTSGTNPMLIAAAYRGVSITKIEFSVSDSNGSAMGSIGLCTVPP